MELTHVERQIVILGDEIEILHKSLTNAHRRIEEIVKALNALQQDFQESDLLAFRAFLRTHPDVFADIKRSEEILGTKKPNG